MEQSSLFIPFISIFGLILFSAFFSGSETGLMSVSGAKIHKLKMEGNKRAGTVSKLLEDKEKLIGAILLGNNIVNIGASALATALAINLVGESGVVYATVIMTLLVLVFAEVMPKTYAVRNAEGVALTVAPLFILITKLLSPVTIAIQFFVSKLIALISEENTDNMTGVEVLRGAVDMYHQEGNVSKEHKDMLSGVFDLQDITVEEVMIHRSDLNSINIEESNDKIISYIAESVHSRIPVWKGAPDQIIGFLYGKDIFRVVHNYQGDLEKLDLKQYIRTPWFVPESLTLKNQLTGFRERQEHIALVVDEYGSVTGMLTLEDILEEVVGEIDDEHDEPTDSRIKKIKDGSYDINGDITLRDLNRETDWLLKDEEATTLAGYVFAHAQTIPEAGQEFEIGEFKFKILARENNQLTKIKVQHFKCDIASGKSDHDKSDESPDKEILNIETSKTEEMEGTKGTEGTEAADNNKIDDIENNQ